MRLETELPERGRATCHCPGWGIRPLYKELMSWEAWSRRTDITEIKQAEEQLRRYATAIWRHRTRNWRHLPIPWRTTCAVLTGVMGYATPEMALEALPPQHRHALQVYGVRALLEGQQCEDEQYHR